jgi:hypothetical protein
VGGGGEFAAVEAVAEGLAGEEVLVMVFGLVGGEMVR